MRPAPMALRASGRAWCREALSFPMNRASALCDGPQAFVSELHSAGQRWVPILDPVVHISGNYTPYRAGLEAGVFMRDLTGSPYVGEVRMLKRLRARRVGLYGPQWGQPWSAARSCGPAPCTGRTSRTLPRWSGGRSSCRASTTRCPLTASGWT